MPSVPLPFLVAVLLLAFLVQTARGEDARANRRFLLLLAVCALQSVLIGLRWGYGVTAVGFLAPIVAATVPPLALTSFSGLARAPERDRLRWLHALPAGLVACLIAAAREAVDIVLILVYLGYAAALLRLAWTGPDTLRIARLESATPAHRAVLLAAGVLAASAGVDVAVMLDLHENRGVHAAAIVGTANLLSLMLLGVAGAVGGQSQVESEGTAADEMTPDLLDPEIDGVVARIDDLMRAEKVFRNANLNLNRLARQAGLPPRRISAAINRLRGKNVSQYINGYRIAEACRLLASTDLSVTRIMFDAGFQTKSNFNREFRRVTGMSPLAWRESKGTSNGGS